MSDFEEFEDFDDMDNMDEFEDNEEEDDGERQPITKTLKKDAKDILAEFTQPTVKQHIIEAAENIAPHIVGDDAINVFEETKRTIVDGSKEVREEAADLLDNVEELAGEDSLIGRFVRKVADKIRPEQSGIISSERSSDQIAEEYASAFLEQSDSLQKIQEKMIAIQTATADQSTKLILKSQEQTFSLLRYSTSLSEKYYRKSIELKYRHILEAKKQTKLLGTLYDGSKALLESISRNTALPDLVKLRSTEALKAHLRENVFNSIYENFGKNNNWDTTLINRIKERVFGIFDGILNSLSTADTLLGMASQTKELGASRGSLIGGMLRPFLWSKFGSLLSKTETGKRIEKELGSFKVSPYAYLDYYSKNSDGILGKLAGKAADFLKPDESMENKLDLNVDNLDTADTLDVRTKESINIVPTLLGNILEEVRAIRECQGCEKPKSIKYDHRRHKFIETDSFNKILRDEISRGLRHIGTKNAMESIFTHLDENSDEKLTDKEKQELARRLYKRSRDPSFSFRYIDEDDPLFKNISKERRDRYLKIFKNATDTDEKFTTLETNYKNLATNRLAITKRIEDLIKSGFTKELEDAGILKYDDITGSYIVDERIYESITADELSKLLDGKEDILSQGDTTLRRESAKATKEFIDNFTRKAKIKTDNTLKDIKRTVKNQKEKIVESEIYKDIRDSKLFKSVNENRDSLEKSFKEVKDTIFTAYKDNRELAEEEWKHFKENPKRWLEESRDRLLDSSRVSVLKDNLTSFTDSIKREKDKLLKSSRVRYEIIKRRVNQWRGEKFINIKDIIEEKGFSLEDTDRLYEWSRIKPKEFISTFGSDVYEFFSKLRPLGIKELYLEYLNSDSSLKERGSNLLTRMKEKFSSIGVKTLKDPALDILKDIRELLDEKKKRVFGDADGDGDRDGSWRDILSRREKNKSEGKIEESNSEIKSKDSSDKSFLTKLLLGLGTLLTSSFGKLLSGIGSLLGIGKGLKGGLVGALLSGLGGIISKGVFTGMKKIFKLFGLSKALSLLGKLSTLLVKGSAGIGKLLTKTAGAAATVAALPLGGKKAIKERLSSKLLNAGKNIASISLVGMSGLSLYEWLSKDSTLTDKEKEAILEVERLQKQGLPVEQIETITKEKYGLELSTLLEKYKRSQDDWIKAKNIAISAGGAYATHKVLDRVLNNSTTTSIGKSVGNTLKNLTKKGGKVAALAAIAYGAYNIFFNNSDNTIELSKNEAEAYEVVKRLHKEGKSPEYIDKFIKDNYNISLDELHKKIVDRPKKESSLLDRVKDKIYSFFGDDKKEDSKSINKENMKSVYDISLENHPNTDEGWSNLIKNQVAAATGLAIGGTATAITAKKISSNLKAGREDPKELKKKAEMIDLNIKKESKGIFGKIKGLISKAGRKLLDSKAVKLLKKLPGVGTVMGLGLAAKDIADGRYGAAALNVLASIAKSTPVGMALSLGSLLIPDSKKEDEREDKTIKSKESSKDTIDKDSGIEVKPISQNSQPISTNISLDNIDSKTPGGIHKENRVSKTTRVSPISTPTGEENELCGIKYRHKVIPELRKKQGFKKLTKVKYIVLHWTAGSRLEFNTARKYGYSAQLWIDKDGSITLLNNLTDRHWAVGRTEKMPSVRNHNSISIEVVGSPPGKIDEPPTKAQVESMKRLVACLLAKFNLTTDDLRYHGELTARKHPLEGKRYVEILKGANLKDLVGKDIDYSANSTVIKENSPIKSGKLTTSSTTNISLDNIDSKTPGGIHKESKRTKSKSVIHIPKDKSKLCGINYKQLDINSVKSRSNSRRLSTVYYIILHWSNTDRLPLSTIKKSGIAAQLYIDRDGSVILINELDEIHYNIGLSELNPKVLNSNSIHIELIDKPVKGKAKPTQKQIESLKRVTACLFGKYNLNISNVTYHGALTKSKDPNEGKEYLDILKGVTFTNDDREFEKANMTTLQKENSKQSKTPPLLSSTISSTKAILPKDVDGITQTTPATIGEDKSIEVTKANGKRISLNIPAKERELLKLISKYERAGKDDYNSIFGGNKYLKETLTDKSIREVYTIQDRLYEKTKGTKYPTTAVGRYQFLKKVLQEEVQKAGLSEDTLFTPDVQDYLILNRLKRMRGLDKWESNQIDDRTFAHNLSMEFASIEDPYKGNGEGHYSGQKAHLKYSELKAGLERIKSGQSTKGSELLAQLPDSSNTSKVSNLTSTVTSTPVDSNNITTTTTSPILDRPESIITDSTTTQPIVQQQPEVLVASRIDTSNSYLKDIVSILKRIEVHSKEKKSYIKEIKESNEKSVKHIERQTKELQSIKEVKVVENYPSKKESIDDTTKSHKPVKVADISTTSLQNEAIKRRY